MRGDEVVLGVGVAAVVGVVARVLVEDRRVVTLVDEVCGARPAL